MSSELELLKQRITELEAENVEIAELRKENAELRKENTVIRDLRIKLSVSDAEIAELKRRSAETLRSNAEYNERRDAENAKLKARIEELEKNSADTSAENAEFRDRLTKVEQKQTLNDNTPNDNTPNDNNPNNNSSNFNSSAVHHEKSSQDKETDDFLEEKHKKIVSEDIRRHNKEKKLQRESANQDVTFGNAYVSETVNNIEKTDMPSKSTFGEITNCTSSELSHETEVIEDISNSAVDSNTINDRSVSEKSELSGNFVNKIHNFHDQNIVKSIEGDQLDRNLSSRKDFSIEIEDDFTVSSEQEVERDLMQQLSVPSTSIDTEIPPNPVVDKKQQFSVTVECIVYKFRKAVRSGHEEILHWYGFAESYDKRINEIRTINKVKINIAKQQVYQEVKKLLPDISDVNLRQQLSRARKLYKLFNAVGVEKIKQVTYSANAISNLNNTQIQNIIDYVLSKAITDDHQNPKNNQQVNASEAQEQSLDGPFRTDSAEVSVSTAPIPSSHVSAKRLNGNSPGDSSIISPVNSPKSQASVPSATSRTPIPRTNPNKMECLYQYAVEHGLDPEKFSIVTEADKKRWAWESFRGILEVDMRFYCGAMERKEDPRKYHKFLTDRERMIGEELLRRDILKHRSSTTWLDDLMEEWEKIHTQFIQVFGQASSGDSSSSKVLVEVVPPIPQPEKNLPTSEENSSDDCAKDCVYFDKEVDSTPQSVKETNEEMPDDSDDDGYNGYGGYNEYGERDRGYYYRDGGYERKTSPMMSPIISPVTA